MSDPLKIAVYAIAKNESKFISRFMESCRGADGIFILDTGSTDDTADTANKLGATVRTQIFSPWRFDHARNEALGMVPMDYDICIALDLDEVMPRGWRKAVEDAWGTSGKTTDLEYEFAWSHKPDGSSDLIYWAQKIHSRMFWTWKHPVHEVLAYMGPPGGRQTNRCAMLVHHWPDDTKSRSSYLPLLELSVQEDPTDDRNAHYLAREYFFYGRYEEAAKEFERHLSLTRATWGPERAASLRYLARIADKKGKDLTNQLARIALLDRATYEAPHSREPWVDLAYAQYENQKWPGCYSAALRAVGIGPERTKEYLTLDSAWGPLPWDLLAIAAYRLGKFDEALEAGLKAVQHDKADVRLQNNVAFYRAGVEAARKLTAGALSG